MTKLCDFCECVLRARCSLGMKWILEFVFFFACVWACGGGGGASKDVQGCCKKGEGWKSEEIPLFRRLKLSG